MSEEANDNSGLLDGVSVEDPSQPTTSSQEQSTIEHLQKPAGTEDDTPLDRPDFWPEKFWNKDKAEPDLEGISKSYVELEKKFRAGGHKAPEGGKYNLEALEGLNQDDPVVQSYLGWAQKYGISQQAFEDLAKEITTMGASNNQQAQLSAKKEREALGPNADAIIGNMTSWARGMVQKGIWSGDDFEEYKVWGGTAQGMKALMKLRETYEGRVPVETLKNSGETAMSDEELSSMVADPKYKVDAGYRAKVEKLFEKRYG
jgi:hypothetical protein